jgi:hypothetical protein
MLSTSGIANAEERVKRLRQLIANQRAVVELMELRYYREALHVANRLLAALPRIGVTWA